jgi:hypothetical protein
MDFTLDFDPRRLPGLTRGALVRHVYCEDGGWYLSLDSTPDSKPAKRRLCQDRQTAVDAGLAEIRRAGAGVVVLHDEDGRTPLLAIGCTLPEYLPELALAAIGPRSRHSPLAAC